MKHFRKVCLLGLGFCVLTGCNPSGATPYDNLRTCTAEDGTLDAVELSTFEGSIVLSDGFPDRSNLNSVVVITGNLGGGGFVGEPLSLEGLNSLEIVEGGVTFVEDNLVDYSGVPRLRSVGSFGARSVPALEGFRGLENLAEVHGNMTTTSNPKLRSLAGLDGLERVHGDVRIRENPLLSPAEIETFLERVRSDGEVK